MRCPACSHENQGGNFCEECGERLVPQQSAGTNPNQTTYQQETAAALEQQGNFPPYAQVKFSPSSGNAPVNTQPNQYLEGAKNISKMYFGYFIEVLKNPFSSARSVGSEQFINGLITIILFAIIIPLTIYFGLKNVVDAAATAGSSAPDAAFNAMFSKLIVRPIFTYIPVLTLLTVVYTIIAVKLAKVTEDYKAVVSRFGSFLIPFVAILLLALIMSILKMNYFVFFLIFGFLTSVILVPSFVITSFKKNLQTGLDTIYCTLLTNLLTAITLMIMANMFYQSIKSTMFSGFFGGF